MKNPGDRLALRCPPVISRGVKADDPLPFCVYILLSLKDNNFYVGFTTDLPRRLDEHLQGRNASTAPRRPSSSSIANTI
jgi:hypothetical protein